MKPRIRLHKFSNGEKALILELVFCKPVRGYKSHGIALFRDRIVLSFGAGYKEYYFKKGQ